MTGLEDCCLHRAQRPKWQHHLVLTKWRWRGWRWRHHGLRV